MGIEKYKYLIESIEEEIRKILINFIPPINLNLKKKKFFL